MRVGPARPSDRRRALVPADPVSVEKVTGKLRRQPYDEPLPSDLRHAARDENREWAGPLQAMQAFVRLQSTSELPLKCKCFWAGASLKWLFLGCFLVVGQDGTCPGRMHSPEKNASDRLH